jgi:type IV fimbrial biogenesis protein FimT
MIAKTAGFTLFELLVSITILAILATLAVPSFTGFIADQRVKAASFDLMSALTLARSEAIKRNASAATPVNLVPSGGSWANGWTVTAPDGSVLNRQDARQGITVTCVTGGAPAACVSVSYLGSGRLASTTPSLQVGGASSTTVRCIVTDLSGQPSSRTGACP